MNSTALILTFAAEIYLYCTWAGIRAARFEALVEEHNDYPRSKPNVQ